MKIHIDGYFLFFLTAIFMILKLTHIIFWSWFWVLSPCFVVSLILGSTILLYLLVKS